MNGTVTIYFADGSKFRGDYKEGKRFGNAIEEDKNGVRFEGTYKNNIRNGQFTERDRNGNVTTRGYYENGIRHTN